MPPSREKKFHVRINDHPEVDIQIDSRCTSTPIFVAMFLATWFIVLTFSFTLSVTASGNILRANRSPITFPVARRINLTTIHHLVRHDQSRAKLLKAQGAARASGLIVHNDRAVINSQADNQAVSYVASVGIGTPATTCKWQLNLSVECLSFK